MPPAPPTAFPAPETYAVAQRIALIATPGAIIHYTIDGTMPTTTSPVCDRNEVVFLPALNGGNTGLHTTTMISAIAVRDGQTSAVVRRRWAWLCADLRPIEHHHKDSPLVSNFLHNCITAC